MLQESPVYKCPHCGRCIAIADECDEPMFVSFHKGKPAKKPYELRLLSQRRCGRCGKDFVVKCFTSVSTLLRWLIFTDPDAIARELFENNLDLVEKLRQDTKFMALINKESK